MERKKYGTAILVAIIGAVGLGVAGYLQSPLADTQYQERPIIDVSFSDWKNHEYPKEFLESDGTNFFIKILAKNSGNSKGKIIVTVSSINAKVSFFENGEYTNQQSLPFIINQKTNYTSLSPPIFVKPDNNSRFSVEFSVVNSINQNPFQELNPFIPTKLVYDYVDGSFQWIDKPKVVTKISN